MSALSDALARALGRQPSSEQLANAQIAAGVANQYGVNPWLAIATGIEESGLRSVAPGDYVNGRATSFGLYQLHEGGELGNLTPAEANNPRTNAQVALSTLKAFQKSTGKTGGALAAAAQRPADPAGYAAIVDRYLAKLTGGSTAGGNTPFLPGQGGTPGWITSRGNLPPSSASPLAGGNPFGALNPASGPVAIDTTNMKTMFGFDVGPLVSIAVKSVFAILGLALIGGGVFRAVKPSVQKVETVA